MKYRYVALISLILLLTLILVGCGGKTSSDKTTPTTAPSGSQNELYSSQPDSPSEEGIISSEQYTKEPDEMEIITLPDQSPSEVISPDTPVENTPSENTHKNTPVSNPVITEPTFPLNSGEKIELPFVPAE